MNTIPTTKPGAIDSATRMLNALVPEGYNHFVVGGTNHEGDPPSEAGSTGGSVTITIRYYSQQTEHHPV